MREISLKLCRWCGWLLLPAMAYAQPAATPEDTIWTQVSLYRDTWGTPHLYAETPAALAFGFGYAQAQDHLETMLLAYRSACGRVAEILGEDFAASDEFALKVASRVMADRALEEASPLTLDLCAGFAQGVNAWMIAHPDEAPEWAEGVEPGDVLALWHAFIVAMAPLDAPGIFKPPHPMETGNAWALAPFRTKEDGAILVINPHQYRDGPFRWCEAHLCAPPYDVAGFTLYGLPILLQGHNAAIGWGLTPNAADFADLYEEHAPEFAHNPKDPRIIGWEEQSAFTLEYMAQSQPYYIWTPEGQREAWTPALLTERGPVLESEDGALYTWRIGGFHAFDILDQAWEMGCAPDLDAFLAALSRDHLPCFHLIYADADGHIAYRYTTSAGTREVPEGMNIPREEESGFIRWDQPLPPQADIGWRYYIPPNALPTLIDPASGYLQACGNPPWTVTDEAPFRPDSWPYWFANDFDTLRAKRIRQLLRNGQRSFQDNHSILYDTLVPAAVALTPQLLKAAEEQPAFVENAHPDLRNGLGLLKHWNYVAEPHQKGMAFYHFWWLKVRERTREAFPHDYARYDFLAEGSPEAQRLMLEAAGDAARLMRNEYQSLEIPWGEIHRLRHGESDCAAPGAFVGDPILFSAGDGLEEGRLYSSYGYGGAMVLQFTDRVESLSILPFGASEDPHSPHATDQMKLFLDKRMKRGAYYQDQVWRYAQSVYGARVGLYPEGVEGLISVSAPTPFELRLATTVDAPAPLPNGLAAFTLFMQPQAFPVHAAASTLLDIYIPKAICLQEDLGDLGLCLWSENGGWRKLAQQDYDPQTRMLSATTREAGVFVVLGPAQCFITPEPPEEAPEPEEAPPIGDPPETAQESAPESKPTGTFSFIRHDAPVEQAPAVESSGADGAPFSLAPGQKFRLERHDQPQEEADEKTAAQPQESAGSGRVIMSDDPKEVAATLRKLRSEKPPAEATEAAPAPLPETSPATPLKEGQKFKLERLDNAAQSSEAPAKKSGGRVFMVDDFSKLPEDVRPTGVVRKGPPPAQRE